MGRTADLMDPPPSISRRRFLQGLATCTAAAAGGLGWMKFIEPSWLQRSRHLLSLPRVHLARSLRLAHLSDLHASPIVPYRLIEQAVAETVALRPDIICLTGDYITRHLEAPEAYARLLKRLADAAPTFAVLGNHDGGAWSQRYGGQRDTRAIQRVMDEAAIECLSNRSVLLDIDGQPVRLIGVGDWWAGHLNPREAFAHTAPRLNVPSVLLSHNPDTKERLGAHDWDLLLSGHTHGGQLSLPLIGTPFAPVRDHRYVRRHRGQSRHTCRSALREWGERNGDTQKKGRVHAYVLMRNHYHLLLETPEPNLVTGMKWLQQTYTQRFNAQHKRSGHLFQGRYKSIPVDAEETACLQSGSRMLPPLW